jgi:MSHA biogenesis protein MshG
MPSFTYKGRDNGGRMIEGVQDGATAAAVADLLFGRGITPLEITTALSTPAFKLENPLAGMFAEKIGEVDVMLFSRQIYTLLKAGVPIMRALAGLQESTSNKAMKGMLQDVRGSLDSGRDLSASMARHPKIFSNFYLAMVRVGEMTGRLEEIFLRLYHHMEFEKFMRDQVKAALRYPTFVMIAMAVAMAVINIFVIPAFAKVFKGFNAELPILTRLLLGFSDFTVEYWPVIFGAVAVAGWGFKAWIGTARGRYLWDRTKLRLPIAGNIVRKATLARFSRSLALALKSGVSIVQALTTTAMTVDNAFMANRIEKMRESVERGESILRSAIAVGIFTPVVLQMIAVGEESGAIDDMLQEVAEMYQREVEYELKTLGQQIEPILIVFLGILVLILALGVFLPIWDLGKVALKK